MWRKRNSTVGENINLFSHYIKQYDGSLKAKIKVNIRFCNNTSRRISRRKKKKLLDTSINVILFNPENNPEG